MPNQAPPPPPPGKGRGPGGMPMPPQGGQPGLGVVTHLVQFVTEGHGHMINLTPDVVRLLKSVGFIVGNVTIFVPGSTGSITTIEFEPGLEQDLPNAMEVLAPTDAVYQHNERWHDGNGHSHVRASVIGPSVTIPYVQRRLMLGQWQQVVLIDWDNRGRQRDVIFQFIGAKEDQVTG